MKHVITATEAIAIIKFKQEENSHFHLTDPQKAFNNSQINLLNLYIDSLVDEVKPVVENQKPERERIILNLKRRGRPKGFTPAPKKLKMPLPDKSIIDSDAISTEDPEEDVRVDDTVEAEDKNTTVTEEERAPEQQQQRPVPPALTPAEIVQQIIEDKVPNRVTDLDEELKNDIIRLATKGNKVHALRAIMHFYGDTVRNPTDAQILLNELLGLDPFKNFKETVARLYAPSQDYSAAFAYVKSHLPYTVKLTTDPKQNEAILHRFTWNAINETVRKEEIASRKLKRNAQPA